MMLLPRLTLGLLHLMLALGVGQIAPNSGRMQSDFPLGTPRLLVGQVLAHPDTLKMQIFAALAKGDVEAAVAAYMANKGLTDAPRWLQAFQAAFNVANRQMGRCSQVARDIHAALTRFGGSPEYVRVSSTEGEYLSWSSKQIMSDNNVHFAVRCGGRIYDAFTGVSGMLEQEYMASIHALGRVSLVVTGEP
ncbi:hypothetical protein [Archangium lipolyticum]|uniref:hypothetical protein n=1 Tax=Archangium lipolyticum TaxID=2970465 RepID=UPI002149E249|nr:hypothetical protein [Archangium lipolyticum]